MSKDPADRQQKGGYAAPIKIDSEAAAKRVDEAKRVAIFEIDGVAYDMPAAARAELGLEFLSRQEEDGEDAAAYWLLIETLGRDAYSALKSVRGLTGEAFEGIMVRIQAIALPKGQLPTTSSARR